MIYFIFSSFSAHSEVVSLMGGQTTSARVVSAPLGIGNSRTKSWSFRSFRSAPTFKRRFSELPPVLSTTFDDTDQGYLLKGINDCSGVALKAVRLLLTTNFSHNFSLLQLLDFFQLLQTMLVKYGFNSESFFWEKNLY